MENAGLITYARTLLLSPPERETEPFLQGYLSVAAHEIAHQWFGNLVTPEYWDDIWLNEAFATWLEAKITHRMRPEWKRDIEMVDGRNGVMGQDSLISTRRIRQPIESNGDIVNAFDGITYTKGASVIGMFEKWMGEEEFRSGVQRYMKQYAWRNATAGMFLDAISAPKGRSVSAAFGTFLNQAGVPLLNVEVKCGGPRPVVAVRQSRFLPLGSRGDEKVQWQLPFCVTYEQGGRVARQCLALTAPVQEMALETSACPAWLNGNAEAAGYYRVQYQGDWLQRLVQKGELSEAETVEMLGNALALAGAGRLPVRDIVALSRKYARDPKWTVASRAFELLQSLEGVAPEADRPALARLVQAEFGERARKLGWTPRPGDSPETNEERRQLVPGVAQLGEDQVLRDEALRLARAWLRDRNVLPDDAARGVLRQAARQGGPALFDEIRAALQTTRSRSERSVLISALASTNDPALTQQSFAMLLGKQVDFREGLPLLYQAMGGSRTRTMPYELVREKYDEIMAIAPGGGSFNFGSSLPMTGSAFCEVEKAAEVRAFFRGKLAGVTGAERSINNAVETIELCAARKQAIAPQVREALQGN
jgi:alanyl aminopeptidase